MPEVDLTCFYQSYQQEQLNVTTRRQRSSVPAVIDDRDESIVSHREERPDACKDVLEALLMGARPYCDLFLRPEACIPPPEPMPIEPSDLAFLDPLDLGSYLRFSFDDSMLREPTPLPDVTQLYAKAEKKALDVDEQRRLVAALNRNPPLAFKLPFVPQRVPHFIEHNPQVACELLRCYLSLPAASEHAKNNQAFLQQLRAMELSIQFMEVVSHLSSSGALPSADLRLLVGQCIGKCENVPDRFMQHRLVRLVCVFFHSAMRGRLIDFTRELLIEIQAFCVQFSRIREASTLYRFMKQLDVCFGDFPEGDMQQTSDLGDEGELDKLGD